MPVMLDSIILLAQNGCTLVVHPLEFFFRQDYRSDTEVPQMTSAQAFLMEGVLANGGVEEGGVDGWLVGWMVGYLVG